MTTSKKYWLLSSAACLLFGILMIFIACLTSPQPAKAAGACYLNSDCGTNGFVGGKFCQGNIVYENYKTYVCQNPGAGSTCFNSSTPKSSQFCGFGKTCSSGSCNNVTIACSSNSQCGTSGFTGSPFCQGNTVYKNYKTYTCQNPGTASSVCSNDTKAQLQNTCSGNQTCANGSCNGDQTGSCSTNAQCGTDTYTGDPYCSGNSVYRNYKTFACNNAGTSDSYCANFSNPKLQTTCTGNQVCQTGKCSPVTCNTNSDCGTNGVVGSPFCQGNSVYENYQTYVCQNPGSTSTCFSSSYPKLKSTCRAGETCVNRGCAILPI